MSTTRTQIGPGAEPSSNFLHAIRAPFRISPNTAGETPLDADFSKAVYARP
ncbi:MAG: hypothetical protein M4D80_07235 [Myxococcota bacterium]|nr:hypothetical protein [Deltaproteobacteria bacterium]MDQ3334936.1 hypothetical protein [Myxococcota bacterium]